MKIIVHSSLLLIALLLIACVNDKTPGAVNKEVQPKPIVKKENENEKAATEKPVTTKNNVATKNADALLDSKMQNNKPKKNIDGKVNKNKSQKPQPPVNQQKQNNKKKEDSKGLSTKTIISDTRNGADKRLKALQSFSNNITNERDYIFLKELVQNETESIVLRETALKKIYKQCGQDEAMLEYMFSVLSNKNTAFKKEILYTLQTLKYSSQLLQKKRSQFLNALQKGLYNTSDKKTYKLLLKTMADENHPFAHETVIDLLKAEDFNMLSIKEMLLILKKNKRPEHSQALHRLMQTSKNEEIKTQLIPLLINEPNSKAYIIKIIGDKNEPLEIRLACVKTIMKEDDKAFYSFTRNIIMDRDDNIKLRRACLSMIKKADIKTIANYTSLKEDMQTLGISDNTLNKYREELLEKLN